MDLQDLLYICKAYRNLGDAVAEQVWDAGAGELDKCNPNALEMIERDFLRVAFRAARDDDELLDELAQVMRDIQEHLAPRFENCGCTTEEE
jgi:hypothetical protein